MSVTESDVAAARAALHERYADVLSVNPDLDCTLVSFQANKREPFYGWFKYKEGFSSRLVRYFLDRLAPGPGDMLDPFAGAGAALFASREVGWNATGIELLPVGVYAMHARHSAERVDSAQFARASQRALEAPLEQLGRTAPDFPHLRITRHAFSPSTERQIRGFGVHCDDSVPDPHVRTLLRFACFCVLEDVSYTRKDGQYLRWDERSARKRLKGNFRKGDIPSFKKALRVKLRRIADDLSRRAFLSEEPERRGALEIREGSCLDVLPSLRGRSFDLVVTSPPYCNRYDYTRTYALELAFLGYDDESVKALRQRMLSCTVENKSKVDEIEESYRRRRKVSRFEKGLEIFESQEALHEILEALERHRDAGRLNNTNIPRMVRNYFLEMAFVILELARVLRSGGRIVMVNDNVRYAGEHVPVDLILSDMAFRAGLRVERIWTLPCGKGNSSQQMGAHGRQELRKCVYLWGKPKPKALGTERNRTSSSLTPVAASE